MKAKEKKEWLDLFQLANEILELKPWTKLWDTNVCAYIDEKTNKKYYFCTMGKAGEFKGISVYEDDEVQSLFEFASSRYPSSILLNYQQCINIFFGQRFEMIPENKDIIKELGLNFKKTWIGFEKFRKGYDVLTLSIEDVRKLLHVLPHYLEVVKDLMKKKNPPELSQFLCYTRCMEKGKFVHKETSLFPPINPYTDVFKLPSSIKKRIQKLPDKEMGEIEVEFTNSLPVRISSLTDQDGKRRFPYINMVVDKTSRIVLHTNISDMKDFSSMKKYVLSVLDTYLDLFEKMGVPQVIYVRDEEAYYYLEELADLLGAELLISPRMEELDHILDEIIENI